MRPKRYHKPGMASKKDAITINDNARKGEGKYKPSELTPRGKVMEMGTKKVPLDSNLYLRPNRVLSAKQTIATAHAQLSSCLKKKIYKILSLELTENKKLFFTELANKSTMALSTVFAKMSQEKRSQAMESYALEKEATLKGWWSKGLGLRGTEEIERGRKELKMGKEGELDRRKKELEADMNSLPGVIMNVWVRKAAEAMVDMKEGWDKNTKSKLIGVLGMIGVRCVIFNYNEDIKGTRLNINKGFLAGHWVVEHRKESSVKVSRRVRDRLFEKLAKEVKEKPEGDIDSMEKLVQIMKFRHSALHMWADMADRMEKGKRWQASETHLAGPDATSIKVAAPDELEGRFCGRRLKASDWALLPSVKGRGSRQEKQKKDKREKFREAATRKRFKKVMDIYKPLENYTLLSEVWQVDRTSWEELGKFIMARAREGLKFVRLIGVDAEGQGATLQVSFLTETGTFTMVFLGFWIPTEFRRLLRDENVFVASDRGDDVSLIIGSAWNHIILDPALIAYETAGWGNEGRTGVAYLAEKVGVDMKYVKNKISKDISKQKEARFVRRGDWEGNIKGFKSAYAAADSEMELANVVREAVLYTRAHNYKDWKPETDIYDVMRLLRYGEVNRTVNEKNKMTDNLHRNIKEGTAGLTVGVDRTYMLPTETDNSEVDTLQTQKLQDRKNNPPKQGKKKSKKGKGPSRKRVTNYPTTGFSPPTQSLSPA